MILRFELIISIFLCSFIYPTYSANILGLFASQDEEQFNVYKLIMMELAKKGNNVTVFSSHSIQDKLDNYNEYVVKIQDDNEAIDFSKNPYEIGLQRTDLFLGHDRVVKLIKNFERIQYDLIIVEELFQEALLMFGRVYNTSIVAINSKGIDQMQSGLLLSKEQLKNLSEDVNKMSLWQRLEAIMTLWNFESRKNKYLNEQQILIQKHFSHLSDPIPSMHELQNSVSIVLINNHIPLNIPKPMKVSNFYVGGVHLPSPQTTIWDVKRFLDDSTRGVIYFNLNRKTSEIPKDKLQIILNEFKKLKQRVIWKSDNEELPNRPDNIMIKKWVSQSDVLAHPHVQYIITNGGSLSIQEGLYRNVPILGLPQFADEHSNMNRLTELGCGLTLDFENITEHSFSWAVNELITNQGYTMKMRENSQIYRDRTTGAMYTTIHWIEYVIRYKGAKHLKYDEFEYPWYSLYIGDIILFIGFTILISVAMVILLAWLGIIFYKEYKEHTIVKKLDTKDF